MLKIEEVTFDIGIDCNGKRPEQVIVLFSFDIKWKWNQINKIHLLRLLSRLLYLYFSYYTSVLNINGESNQQDKVINNNIS